VAFIPDNSDSCGTKYPGRLFFCFIHDFYPGTGHVVYLHVKSYAWFNVFVCKGLRNTRLDPENKAGKAEGCLEELTQGRPARH
jgi:hypothetical protein